MTHLCEVGELVLQAILSKLKGDAENLEAGLGLIRETSADL